MLQSMAFEPTKETLILVINSGDNSDDTTTRVLEFSGTFPEYLDLRLDTIHKNKSWKLLGVVKGKNYFSLKYIDPKKKKKFKVNASWINVPIANIAKI